MRTFTVVLLTLLLCVLLLAPPALADDSPLPTPTPPPATATLAPPTTPTPAPILPETGDVVWPEDPTDLFAVFNWLIGGGAGAFVAVWIEKQKWFQNIAGQWKPTVVMGSIALTALLPKLLLDFTPVGLWQTLAPYFALIVSALLVGYPTSQVLHRFMHQPPTATHD